MKHDIFITADMTTNQTLATYMEIKAVKAGIAYQFKCEHEPFKSFLEGKMSFSYHLKFDNDYNWSIPTLTKISKDPNIENFKILSILANLLDYNQKQLADTLSNIIKETYLKIPEGYDNEFGD